MRIAFVSYEYPPETADGGIATYVLHAAYMLSERGHRVEVFAARRDPGQEFFIYGPGFFVHRVQVEKREEFAEKIALVFVRRHAQVGFDVLEGTDYSADARAILRLVPHIPLVVRLHTPHYLAAALFALSMPERERTLKDAADWQRWLYPLPGYDYKQDPEYQHILQADAITAPSQAIHDVICRDWHLDDNQVEVIPNVFEPSPLLLELPVNIHSDEIVYIGRLQQRKGVLPLAHAIPLVLRDYPQARFRFVGRPMASPEPGLDMQQYLQRLLQSCASSVTFSGPVELETIPAVLGSADICVFPSLWENFPYVCLEAMAAGRGIVGSRAGGMAEMLAEGAGLLVEADRSEEIAEAILRLLKNPEQRMQRGQTARERVLRLYSASNIAPHQEASYRHAIQSRRQQGSR